MSSLRLIFLLYLSLMMFSVLSHEHLRRNGRGGAFQKHPGGEDGQGGYKDNKCNNEFENLSKRYSDLANECQCKQGWNEVDVRECFIEKCREDCAKQIGNSVSACDNIDVNQKCNICNVQAFSLDHLRADISQCADHLQQQIHREALQECKNSIDRMQQQRGAQLVCGNISCEQYCDEQVKTGMDGGCGEDITAVEGFSRCQDGSGQYVNQELSNLSAKLPDGFYWKKCSYGMPCAAEIKMAFDQAEQECNNLKAKATICCEDPLKCAEAGSSDLFKSSGSLAGGITENCQRIQEQLKNVGSATQQMAEKCKSIASSCVQVCTQQISNNFLTVFNQYCTFDLSTEQTYDSNKHTCAEDLISNYVKEYAEKLAPVPGQCELVGQKSEQLKQSAEEMLRSSASAQKCAEQASVGSSESEPSPTKEPTQMAVLGPETPNVKTPPTPNNSLRWNPGKGEKGKENIISNASGGSSKRASGRTSKNQVQRANIGARKVSPPPAKKKKGFLSRLLSAFGGSKKNKEKQKEGATVGGGPQAAAGSNNANVGGGGRSPAKAKENSSEKDKTKADKKSKEHSVRQFAKAGSGKNLHQKPRSVLDKGFKPRDISRVKLGKYGSPHDNIFERLSHRIITLCRQKRIDDCQL